jgi:hypothetical protein
MPLSRVNFDKGQRWAGIAGQMQRDDGLSG